MPSIKSRSRRRQNATQNSHHKKALCASLRAPWTAATPRAAWWPWTFSIGPVTNDSPPPAVPKAPPARPVRVARRMLAPHRRRRLLLLPTLMLMLLRPTKPLVAKATINFRIGSRRRVRGRGGSVRPSVPHNGPKPPTRQKRGTCPHLMPPPKGGASTPAAAARLDRRRPWLPVDIMKSDWGVRTPVRPVRRPT